MSDLESVVYHLDTDLFPRLVGVVDVRAVEGLDEPYRVELDVVVKQADADVSALLGTDAVLHIERSPLDRRIVGLVHEVHEGRPPEQGGFPRARLVLGPALGLLRLRRTSRIFQGKTVPEILEAVLNEGLAPYGRVARLELDASYAPREQCVQYQEADLAFVERLMEEEGIYYAFDHVGEREELVLRDESRSSLRVETVPAGGILELHAVDATVRDREPITELLREHRPTATSVVIRDHEWTRDALFVEAEARSEDLHGVDREVYEHGIDRKLGIGDYDPGPRRYQAHDGARQASLRLEALAKAELVARGVSRVTGLVPGGAFELSGHPEPGFDGTYLITRVIHESRPPVRSPYDFDLYHNRFECIPLDVPYRSTRRTPRPILEGVQTAVVTGPSGEEVHVDEHGRIKVRFHWDRAGAEDETSSAWVRVQQPWAGAGWGFSWVPRVGMEVVVHFIDGDPDRPLVTGAVYDAKNAPPYSLPDEKTKSTIKSSSSLGGGGSNELRFEDAAGSEEIYTHAQRDYDEVVERDHTTRVRRHQTNAVGAHQTQTVHVDQHERVDGDQTMAVGGDRRVHVEGDYEETVDGAETRHTVGDVTETFESSETRTLGGSITESIGGNETRCVDGSQSETVGVSHERTIGGALTETIGGALTETAAGGFTSTTPGAHTVTATAGWTVNADAGIVINAAAGLHLTQGGGMTRIDYSWNTDASDQSSVALADFEYYVTKAEVVVFHHVFGIVRNSNVGMSESVTASRSETLSAKAGTFLTRIMGQGLYNRFQQHVHV